jgi:AraC-like DNA-binding protein
MKIIFIDSLAVVTAILLLIFSAFAFTNKKDTVLRNRLLASFLLANSLYIIDFCLPVIVNVTGINLLWFNGIGTAFGFLFGPLLYLYTKSITQKDFAITIKHSPHFIPFIIIFIAALIKLQLPDTYLYAALYIQTTPYMIVSIKIILNHRLSLKNYFSSIDKLNLTWLLYVVGAFFLMWVIDLTNFALVNLNLSNLTLRLYLTFFSLTINFVFAILIFYKALQHPEILAGTIETERQQKYEQSRLTEEEKSEYLDKLREYFKEDKPYLNPEITIAEVSHRLNVSVRYLSQIINESLGKNFYDFINSYRIEEAKRQLIIESDSKKTVLEVLYDSGFNSKSAFNSAFKKHTGFTPTEFRKQPLIN